MARFTKALRQKLVDDYCARNDGRYDPAGFLDEAKSPQHPAHDWFTWDDEKAAEDYRLWQARAFVNDLRVTFSVETMDRGSVRVSQVEMPSMVSPLDTRDTGGGYIAVSPDDGCGMHALRAEAARSLAAWIRRYGGCLVASGGSTKGIAQQLAVLSDEKSKAKQAA